MTDMLHHLLSTAATNEIHDMLDYASWLKLFGNTDRFFSEQLGMKR